jgi:CDP-glycerol glycerophosphotransferase (TagB/SpsB family)
MKKNTILFAPSWNESKENLLEKYGFEIINHLIKKEYNVIFRPHPEHYKRFKEIIKKILHNFEKENKFHLSKNLSDLESLEKSNLLITDYSGISLEFIAVFRRPVILIEVGTKKFNKDWNFSNLLFEDKFKEKFAEKIDCNPLDLENLSNLIEKKINQNSVDSEIDKFLKSNLYNYGNVSKKLSEFFK